MTNNLTRRALLASAPAGGIAMMASPGAADAQDPLVPLYHEWMDARREWYAYADLPGNENWDHPASKAAERRECAAEDQMIEMTPTTIEGIAAMAALAWRFVDPVVLDQDEYPQTWESKAILAIWRAASGRDGYPETGVDYPATSG